MKKKHILIGGICSLIIGVLICLLVYDLESIDTFRTMQDEIPVAENVNLKGLRDLHASGGHIPRFSELQEKIPSSFSRRIILDLTTESHGYVKGIPANFFGYHLPSPKIKHIPRRIVYLGSLEKHPEYIISEADEAKKYNFEYKNIALGSKFITRDKNVDAFVQFFDDLPPDTWVHFHCVQGKGRTSLALVMLDIMKNAPEISLDDIVKRQFALGSVNLFDVALWKKPNYTTKQLHDRKGFIENFYAFISQRKAGGIQSWSEWKKTMKMTPVAAQNPSGEEK